MTCKDGPRPFLPAIIQHALQDKPRQAQPSLKDHAPTSRPQLRKVVKRVSQSEQDLVPRCMIYDELPERNTGVSWCNRVPPVLVYSKRLSVTPSHKMKRFWKDPEPHVVFWKMIETQRTLKKCLKCAEKKVLFIDLLYNKYHRCVNSHCYEMPTELKLKANAVLFC